MPPHPETVQTAADSPPVARLPVLMIVGDPAGLNIARDALIELELGWEVVFAGSAFDAHDIPATREVDVVLVDFGDPHLEGVELVESLHGLFPRLPIVLMSAPYAVRFTLEAIRKGAVNHFPRELLDQEPSAVLEVLRDAARRREAGRDLKARLDQVTFEFTLDNDPAAVPAVVDRVRETVIEMGVSERLPARRVGVALEECLINAIVHGNLEVSSSLRRESEDAYQRLIADRRQQGPWQDRRVRLTATIDRDTALFTVEDEGPGFDAASVPDPTSAERLSRVTGRGLLMMRSFMTSVEFHGCGNRVTLIKRRK